MKKLVHVRDLPVHSDDRGNLFEMLRKDDPEYTKFGQVYLVEDRTPFTIRAFHRHFKLWDWFCIHQKSGATERKLQRALKLMLLIFLTGPNVRKQR